jgi:hypothetical protein
MPARGRIRQALFLDEVPDFCILGENLERFFTDRVVSFKTYLVFPPEIRVKADQEFRG